MTLIHGSIIRAIWNESEEYKIGDQVTRRVFDLPDKISPTSCLNQVERFSSIRGTTDLNFCKRIMRDDIFKKAGWPQYSKKKYPFLVDTDIFVQHIDERGRMYPLGGVPLKYAPKPGSKPKTIK